jgi:predicted metal-dependent hydrolase
MVRRPEFGIDDSVPFQWQPANPGFGLFGNVFTFLAIAFERYVVAATRQAMDRITDPVVAEEADAFLRQEAQHAKAHRAHEQAMIARFPALAETKASVSRAYDDLLASEPLEFHLAYVADLEATFTPLFKMALDNRGELFAGGDERVGTLLLWHFVEEIEHRSSALAICDAVNPEPWYRIRRTPTVVRHVAGVYSEILRGFDRHVGAHACGIDPRAVGPNRLWLSELRARVPRRRRDGSTMLGGVPGRDLRSMVRHVAGSQTPRHDPAHQPLPAWADHWHEVYDAGGDVTTYTGLAL